MKLEVGEGGYSAILFRSFVRLSVHSDCKLHAKATLPEKQRSLESNAVPFHAMLPFCRIIQITQIEVQTNKQKATILKKGRKDPPKMTFKKRKRTARYAELHRILEN